MTRVLAAMLGVAALAFAGCGAGNEKRSLVATGGTPVLTVPITIDEHLVSPKYTRLSIPGTYTVLIENEGAVAHTVAVDISDPGDYELSYAGDGHGGKDVTGLITLGSV
jgi:hypothetical protein